MVNEFRDVPGYGGKYQVSKDGRIRQANRDGSYSIKIVERLKGRGEIVLRSDHGSHIYYTDVLVLESWGGIPGETNPDGSLIQTSPEVYHKDGNPQNDCIDNLEWCDRYYLLENTTKNKLNIIQNKVSKSLNKFANKYILN